jgi:hypothetical protein
VISCKAHRKCIAFYVLFGTARAGNTVFYVAWPTWVAESMRFLRAVFDSILVLCAGAVGPLPRGFGATGLAAIFLCILRSSGSYWEPNKNNKKQLFCAGAVGPLLFWMAAWEPIATLLSFYGVREGSPGARLGQFGSLLGLAGGLPGSPRGCRGAPGACRGISDVFWGLPGPSGAFCGLVACCGFLGLQWGCRALLGPSAAFLGLLGGFWGLPGPFRHL